MLYIDYWRKLHFYSLKVEIGITSNTQTRISQFMFYKNKNKFEFMMKYKKLEMGILWDLGCSLNETLCRLNQ